MTSCGHRFGTPTTVFLTLVIATSTVGASQSFAQGAPTFTVLAEVDQPYGGVILGSDGALYGTSLTGPGVSNCGYVYRLEPQSNGTFEMSTVHVFAGAPTDGCQPRGELVELNGALYGTTSSGGANVDARWLAGTGTVFRIVLSAGQEVLYSFRSFALTNLQGLYPEGVGPIAGLVWGPDGHFYGTTNTGGTAGDFSPGPGTIFKVAPADVTPAGVLTVLHQFSPATGKHIQDALTLGTDGNVYGTSIGSGISNRAGLLFRITPAGVYSPVFTFPIDITQCGSPECYPLGANPWAGPTEVGGAFYVLGNHYGPPPGGYGSIVRVEPSGAGTLVHGFSGGSDGGYPPRALTVGADGLLYGLTGGVNQTGPTIFRVAPDGTTFETLYEFVLGGPGLQGRLLEIAPGEFVGTSASGGPPTGAGFVFRLSLNDVNSAPVAYDGSTATLEDTAVSGQLIATDADSDPLTFSIVSNGTLGTAVITDASTGAFTYTPNANASGADTFTFQASDGSLTSNIATIAVNIAPTPLSVTLISPNGGERVFVSVPITIRWSATGATSFDIALSRNGENGTYFALPECTGLAGSATSCVWTPQAPGSNSSRLRITARAGTATAVDKMDANFLLTTATPAITVTTPNTAVTWAETTSRTIQWNHNLGVGSSVRLELSRNNGATWEVLAASVQNASASSGSYLWSVTGPATTAAVVRVSWLDGPATDVSNTPFAIVATALTVTSPNTAVTWAAGSTRTLAASHNLGAGQAIAFDLSRDGGSTWTAVGVATSTTTSATLSWTVTGPPSTQARIRATWTAHPSLSDMSNVNFTIAPRVTVTAPNTAVVWGAGTLRTVTWTHTLGLGQLVNIDVSPNNGASWSSVATNVPNTTATAGAATVRMPETVTTQALVRVSPVSFPVVDGDVSNVPFTLAAPGVTVTMPNSNVLWTIGSIVNITWTHNLGKAETVHLEVSRDGGTTWTALATNVLNSTNTAGAFTWNVTGPATLQARVRVTWTANGSVQDISNVNFRIQ